MDSPKVPDEGDPFPTESSAASPPQADLPPHEPVAAFDGARRGVSASRLSVLRERNLLSAVLDTTIALMMVLDRDGRIVLFNRACEQTSGYRFDEVRGKRLWDIVAEPGEAERMRACYGDLRAGQPPRLHETQWATKDGRRRLVAWSSNVLVDESRSIGYIVCTGRDITERRQAEEAVRLEGMRLNSLLELSQKAAELSEGDIIRHTLEEVVRLTRSEIGYLHFVNPDQETLQLYTWSRETLKTCTAAHDSHYPLSKAGVWADCARLRRPVIHNDYQNVPDKHGYPEGHSHLVRHASIPVLDGDKVTVILGVGNKREDYDHSDVRQMVLAADALWKILQRKRDEQQMRRHVLALEEANRQKNEFLAMLAHELRNPLAPVSTALEILKRGHAFSESDNEALRVIGRQMGHLTRLVDDLLDVSRITQGRIELRREPTDLAEVVRHAVAASRELIEAHRHELSLALPRAAVTVDGDPVRLTQVLTNLLNNAAKYTPDGGRIAAAVRKEARHAVVSVNDSGVGISREMLPRVFDLFAQADESLGRSQGGLGVGLTLAYKLVQLHGGTVEAFSAGPGRGSEFVVRLPLATGPQRAVASTSRTAPEAASAAGVRVLVVDDNQDAARMLAKLLAMSGHEVHVVHDGPSALETAKAMNPAAILLDIGLEGMDGYEVARRLRREHGDRPLLLIATTGYGHEEAIRRSRQAGFDHHLVKPVDVDALENLLAAQPENKTA